MNECELEQKILTELHDSDVGIDELSRSFADFLSKRTLQRRLEELVAAGKVVRAGRARATKYRANIAPNRATPISLISRPETEAFEIRDNTGTYELPSTEVGPEFRPEPGPTLDESSKQIRDYLREHYSLRTACGYRREFLDSYVPNKTFYLSEPVRQHLREISQSQDMAALPPGTYARQVLDRLIIDLSWNSGRLEGSTYSRTLTRSPDGS